MSTQPARTDTTTPRHGGFPPAAGPATVTVAQRRASDVVQGDVIALPDEVFVPVPARAGQRRTWVWHSKPSHLLDNAHRWRWVYDVDQLDEDKIGLTESRPSGFRLLRVSDDRPDQGQEYRSLVIALRETELVDIQVGTEIQVGTVHGQDQEPDQAGTATSNSLDGHQPANPADRFIDFTAPRRHSAGIQPQHRPRQRRRQRHLRTGGVRHLGAGAATHHTRPLRGASPAVRAHRQRTPGTHRPGSRGHSTFAVSWRVGGGCDTPGGLGVRDLGVR
jgi:hypothetical protein